jgi:hypothetical protein
MTEDRPRESEHRLDLGALDAGPDPARTDAVVAAVMARIAAGTRVPGDEVMRLVRARRHMLATAAILTIIAGAAVLGAPRRAPGDPAGTLITRWSQMEHVPTNGELLVIFQGYRP